MEDKYIVYCRVSSDREDKQVLWVPSQKRELSEIAEKAKLNVYKKLAEEKSAYKIWREKFNEMVELIESWKVNCILTYHLTRLARNALDWARLLYLMDEWKLKHIRTKDKTYENNWTDKFIMQVEFAMSKKSSDDTSAFVKRDIKTKLEKWEYPWVVPHWYLNIDKNWVIAWKRFTSKKQNLLELKDKHLSRVEIDPIEWPIYRKIFELAMTWEYSLSKLIDESFKLWLTSWSWKRLCLEKMRTTLRNPFYYWYFNFWWELWKWNFEWMITKSEYDKIQEVLFKKRRPKKKRNEYMLSSLIKCWDCWWLLSWDLQKWYKYYRCIKAKWKNKTCSNSKHYREDILESKVLHYVENISIPESIVKWSVKELNKANDQETVVMENSKELYRSKLKKYERKLDRLTQKWLSEDNFNWELISDILYKDMKSDIKESIAELKWKLNFSDECRNDWIEKCEQFFEFSRALISTYEKASVKDKKIIIQCIWSNFVLSTEFEDHVLPSQYVLPDIHVHLFQKMQFMKIFFDEVFYLP